MKVPTRYVPVRMCLFSKKSNITQTQTNMILKTVAGFFLIVFLMLPAELSGQTGAATTLDWIRTVETDEEAQLSSHQAGRVHPLVQRLLMMSETSFERGYTTFHDDERTPHVDLIIYTDDGNAVLPGRAVRVVDGIYAVRARKSEVEAFVRTNRYSWIEPALQHEIMLNRTRAETGAETLHHGLVNGVSYTGEGVLAAVFDTGIDFTHPSFRKGEQLEQSRIAFIWDQTLETQPGETIWEPPFDYGVVYTRSDIEAFLSGGAPLRTDDTTGHGTHVADITAGSGNQFRGMAPGADIVVIKGGNQNFSAFDIITAVKFMEHLSETEQKPVVGNFSIGGFFTSRDGTEPTELAMDEAMSSPGRVMVAAAGNSGGQDRFVEGRAGQEPVRFNVPEFTPNTGPLNDVLLFDIWFDSPAEATLNVVAPSGFTFTLEPDTFAVAQDSSQGVIIGENIISPNNGDRRITVQIADVVEWYPPATGQWELQLTGTTENYKAWVIRNSVGNQTVVPDGATTDFSVTTPGSGRSVITAGAYVTQDNWINSFKDVRIIPVNPIESRASFSGMGPTRDGRMKPDISAPGQAIAAAFSVDGGYPHRLATPGLKHIYLSGTSMAAPAVAGSVALLLEAFPQARGEDIKNALIGSARNDEFTDGGMNNVWGGGKLDVASALYSLSGEENDSPWLPVLYHTPGTVKNSGEGSILLNRTEGIVYRLPEFFGVVNGIIMYTGELAEGEHAGAMLEFQLVELTGNRIGEPVGEAVRVPVSDFRPFYEEFVDLSGFGVFVDDRKAKGIRIRMDEDDRSDAATFELLARFLDAGALSSVFRVNASEDRLSPMSPGETLYMDVSASIFSGSSDDVPPGYELPFIVDLGNNYPNPFNLQTVIPFELGEATDITLELYDVMGRRVAVLERGRFEAGRYEHQFEASGLATGVYFYRLRTASHSLTEKMLLIK